MSLPYENSARKLLFFVRSTIGNFFWTRSSLLQNNYTVAETHRIPICFIGITARVAKVAPACAIMITSYEYGKAFFKQRNETSLAVQLDKN